MSSNIIGLNALYIRWGVNAGTETYFTNIVLPWYQREQSEHRFILYCNQVPPWWDGPRPWFDVVVIPAARRIAVRILCEQMWFPLALRSKLSVLFCPGYVGSALLRTRQVVTVHDAYAWRFPAEAGRLRSAYWRACIPWSFKSQNEVIADSDSTAVDLARFCNVSSRRIHVIHLAGSHLDQIAPDQEVLSRLGLAPQAYFHCVGVFKAIKNPSRILDAYELYVSRNEHGKAKKLVLVGHADGEFGQALQERARSIPDVVLAGRLSDAELATVYRASAGLIFASLYEGFGIPILEAQSLDCPVITSVVSSMPEVAGKGAILVDPQSDDDICRAIQEVSEPQRRASLIGEGKKNLTRFSWNRASDRTLALLTGKPVADQER